MTTIDIKTSGMHCTSCEMLITDILEDEEGINNAIANHKSGIIQVKFDNKQTSEDAIKKIISHEGYGVE